MIWHAVTNGVKYVSAFDGIRYAAYADHIDDAKLYKRLAIAEDVAARTNNRVIKIEVTRRVLT